MVPELDSSHAENHSTWALRTGGGQSEDDGGGLEVDAVEEQYEAVGGVDVARTERHESSGEGLENNLVEEEVVVTEAEVAVSFEDQATLKIRQTPPPPLPPKRNGRRTVVEEDVIESDGEGGALEKKNSIIGLHRHSNTLWLRAIATFTRGFHLTYFLD